ncbi:MAG TPA: hypothetical protein VLF19_08210 [Methylomirabilota bacterium]|nr:hypothetical protein [Methylomirabilota bacterium]
MRRALAAVAAVAALGGCTAALDLSGREWSKAGGDIRQITTDEIECVRLVSDIGETVESYVGGVADTVRFALRERSRVRGYDDCMTSRGYARTG